jgi:hypothetical protein
MARRQWVSFAVAICWETSVRVGGDLKISDLLATTGADGRDPVVSPTCHIKGRQRPSGATVVLPAGTTADAAAEAKIFAAAHTDHRLYRPQRNAWHRDPTSVGSVRGKSGCAQEDPLRQLRFQAIPWARPSPATAVRGKRLREGRDV